MKLFELTPDLLTTFVELELDDILWSYCSMGRHLVDGHPVTWEIFQAPHSSQLEIVTSIRFKSHRTVRGCSNYKIHRELEYYSIEEDELYMNTRYPILAHLLETPRRLKKLVNNYLTKERPVEAHIPRELSTTSRRRDRTNFRA